MQRPEKRSNSVCDQCSFEPLVNNASSFTQLSIHLLFHWFLLYNEDILGILYKVTIYFHCRNWHKCTTQFLTTYQFKQHLHSKLLYHNNLPHLQITLCFHSTHNWLHYTFIASQQLIQALHTIAPNTYPFLHFRINLPPTP